MREDDDGDDDGGGDGRPDSDERGLVASIEEMDTERWAEAIVTGAVTYVVGYLIVAVLFFVGPVETSDAFTLEEKLSSVGVTYNAGHNIAVEASNPLLVIADGEGTIVGKRFGLFDLSELLGVEQSLPEWLYLAVPVVLLLAVGFSRAWRLSPAENPWDPVKTTLGMPIGYGAVAYVGSVLFSYPLAGQEFPTVGGISILSDSTRYTFVERGNTTRVLGQSGEIAEIQGSIQSPEMVMVSPDGTSALLLGLAYPVVFATLGALAAVSLRRYRASEDHDGADE